MTRGAGWTARWAAADASRSAERPLPIRVRNDGKARGIRIGKGGKKRGIRVGAALEPRKIGKVFHGDACHGNVERARYTEKHGFGPAAWCLSLSLF